MNVRRLISRALLALMLAFVVLAGAIGFSLAEGSADLSYRTLDYDVDVQADGRMTITQHIDMRLKDRSDDDGDRPWKQLYQQYTINGVNLANITDVSVKNVTTGETYTQSSPQNPAGVSDSAWDSDYAGHWYMADVTESADDPQPFDPRTDGFPIRGSGGSAAGEKTVEIGWNIPATTEADSLKFDVTMTFVGATTLYRDVAAFQWEPFGRHNPIPIGTLTGTVRFPKGIGADDSWAWLHYEGTSETSRGENGSLRFTAYDVRAGQYLDVVAAYDASVVKAPDGWNASDSAGENGNDWIRRGDGDHLATLQKDESRQERLWRDNQRNAARMRIAVWVAVTVLGVVLCVIAVICAFRSYRDAQYHGDIEYWRDPPDMSPAAAAQLAGVLDCSVGPLAERQMTSTILSLASKHAIAIYPGPSEMYQGIDMSQADAVRLAGMADADDGRRAAAKRTSTIVILPAGLDGSAAAALSLSQSEDAALRLLRKISKRVGSPVFDLKQMKKACKSWSDGYKVLERYTTACSNEFALLGATCSGSGGVAIAGSLGCVLGAIASFMFAIQGNIALSAVIGFPITAVGVFALLYAKYTVLTEAGQEYAGQVHGLYRYLTDFSDFSDRGAADLLLWDRYLVYAAAFGISERVLKELAKAYPQIADPDWLDANASQSLLYWSYRPYRWYGYGSAVGGAANAPFDPGAFSANVGDIGAQLNAGFADISSTIQAAAPSSVSGGSFSGGGFGGSSGGSGGGSFGGR